MEIVRKNKFVEFGVVGVVLLDTNVPLDFSHMLPSSTSAVHFSGVANSGISANTAYLSAELSLFSIDFSLVNHQAVPLCYFSNPDYYDQDGEWQQEDGQQQQQEDGYQEDNGDQGDGQRRRRVQNEDYYGNDQEEAVDQYYDQGEQDAENYDQEGNEDWYDQDAVNNYQENNNQCPYDGSYPYKVEYVLPSAGSESASWLASGWTGSGVLQMYANRNDQTLIGECTMVLSTFVSKEDEDTLLGAPSAAATAGIVLAIVFATVLMCFYCYCCIKSHKAKKDNLQPGDDVTSSFRRLDEEDAHSKPGTISVDARSQAASKKSAKEIL